MAAAIIKINKFSCSKTTRKDKIGKSFESDMYFYLFRRKLCIIFGKYLRRILHAFFFNHKFYSLSKNTTLIKNQIVFLGQIDMDPILYQYSIRCKYIQCNDNNC